MKLVTVTPDGRPDNNDGAERRNGQVVSFFLLFFFLGSAHSTCVCASSSTCAERRRARSTCAGASGMCGEASSVSTNQCRSSSVVTQSSSGKRSSENGCEKVSIDFNPLGKQYSWA